jgi:transcriptional regulator with XRE-family HTH domain
MEKIDIKALRGRLGWSQQQLADYLGLDRSSVSRMEKDQEPKGPTRRLLQALAAQTPSAQPDPAREPAE